MLAAAVYSEMMAGQTRYLAQAMYCARQALPTDDHDLTVRATDSFDSRAPWCALLSDMRSALLFRFLWPRWQALLDLVNSVADHAYAASTTEGNEITYDVRTRAPDRAIIVLPQLA